MDLRRVLLQLHGEFAKASIEHALIGGLALAARGIVRATQDVDFLVAGEASTRADAVVVQLGYRPLHRSENAASYASQDPLQGRVDFLFAHRPYARAMLERSESLPVLGSTPIRVVDAADLIGLKVQSSVNDPRRKRGDFADIARLLEQDGTDLERVREYFRLFDLEGRARCAARGARAVSARRTPQGTDAPSPPSSLREMREDAESAERREEFARSRRAQREAEAPVADGLAAALDLCDQLRALFGDPPVERRVWPERDFRL